MRRRWERVHVALVQSVITLQAERQFRGLRQRDRVLVRFESPSALISYLTDRGGNLDEKDLIYATLVRLAQAQSEFSDLATSILWLGLWPGLDGIYGRNLRFFRRSPEDLVSELSDFFMAVIHRADLSRIHRTAATLIRNSERDLRDRLRRIWAEEKQLTELPDDDHLDSDDPRPDVWSSPFPRADYTPSLGRWLRTVAGRDAELLEAVLVYGETQKEAAVRLGMTHAAARKRYQRALERLSHSVSGFGVFPVKGVRR